MAQTVVVNTVNDFDKVAMICETFTEADCFPLDITIKKHDTAIVSAQRGLYWRWLGIMVRTLGGTKEELHETFKESIFLNTYIADKDNHPLFHEGLVRDMKMIAAKAPEQFQSVRGAVLHGVSHLDANRANWIDVLNYVETIANNHNIKLPVSDRKGVR